MQNFGSGWLKNRSVEVSQIEAAGSAQLQIDEQRSRGGSKALMFAWTCGATVAFLKSRKSRRRAGVQSW